MIFPFLWMILTALKTKPEAIVVPPTVLPQYRNGKTLLRFLKY